MLLDAAGRDQYRAGVPCHDGYSSTGPFEAVQRGGGCQVAPQGVVVAVVGHDQGRLDHAGAGQVGEQVVDEGAPAHLDQRDTNIILECYRVGSWRALAGGYSVETVEQCVEETQAGSQRREPERRIDEVELRDSFAAVHSVGDPNPGHRVGCRRRVAVGSRAEAGRRLDTVRARQGQPSLWRSARVSRRETDNTGSGAADGGAAGAGELGVRAVAARDVDHPHLDGG